MSGQEIDSECILKVLYQQIKAAKVLYSLCDKFLGVHGIMKLQKRIKAELNFLQKLNSQPENIKINQLKSSNLPHLAAIIECIFHFDGVIKLLTPHFYTETSTSEQKRVIVDVVADYGRTWIKVVARNPDSLVLLCKGAGKFGKKSVIEQIEELMKCAKQNEYMFLPPVIKLSVIENIDTELLNFLREIEVEVVSLNQVKDGCICPLELQQSISEIMFATKNVCIAQKSNEQSVSSSLELKLGQLPENSMSSDCTQNRFKFMDSDYNAEKINFDLSLSNISKDMTLNLDVSCLLAYISNMTNGFCHITLRDKILNEQAEREKVSPVKHLLDKLFEGHKLICCNSAYVRFINIFTVVGGKQERQRAKELISRLAVVDDDPSVRCMQLQEIGKINKNSQVIFGTGDSLKAVTVTANAGFVRAAKCQGKRFVVYIHESRALSEMKEINDC